MKELFAQFRENATFLGVTLLIVLALALGSKFAERLLPQRRKVSPARRICITAICGAIAAVLHMLDFPLPFLAPGFYKLDLSEVPVLLCGFYLGPASAVVCEVLKILLKLIFKSTSTAFVGDFANFVVGCTMVLPAVFIYHAHKSRHSAVVGLIIGTLSMASLGSLFNALYLIPKFSQLYGLPLDAIIGMGTQINPRIQSLTTFVLMAVVPLNLIKGLLVSVLTMLLYKRVARPLFGK